MPTFVIYRIIEQKRYVEAENLAAAREVNVTTDEGIWIAHRLLGDGPTDPHPYVAKPIDWDAVRKLPKPKLSSDELMKITRGDD